MSHILQYPNCRLHPHEGVERQSRDDDDDDVDGRRNGRVMGGGRGFNVPFGAEEDYNHGTLSLSNTLRACPVNEQCLFGCDCDCESESEGERSSTRPRSRVDKLSRWRWRCNVTPPPESPPSRATTRTGSVDFGTRGRRWRTGRGGGVDYRYRPLVTFEINDSEIAAVPRVLFPMGSATETPPQTDAPISPDY